MESFHLTEDTSEIDGRPDSSSLSSSAPRRSWSRKGKEGRFDFKFLFEGATVFSRFPLDVKGLEELQSELLAEANEVQALSRAFSVLQGEGKNPLPPEKLLAEKQKLEAAAIALHNKQIAESRKLVEECVIGWENGEEPFSVEARADLPNAICMEWMPLILNQARLSGPEAGFLAPNS